MRIQKIAPEGTTNYVYDGNKLTTELAPTYRLDFLYDENGLLYGFVKDSTNVYYYVKDYLQNILGIVDINGKLIVEYNQTAYGIVTIALDTNDIGKINPFRYKGYYYDQESGMYYCQSRYYVPEWGRWLNASIVVNQDGFNAFSYCKNDPIWKCILFNSNYNYFASNEKIASETISVQQVSNSIAMGTNWKTFGYEHRTSAGWETDGRMFTSSILRIGVSSYITHSTAERPSVFYAFTGHVESDSLSLIGETWYAGIGMKWGNVFGLEVQVETLGIAGKVNYGNFSIAVDLNLLGGLSITFGLDEDLGNGYTSTSGFTIGVNFLSLAYVVLAICSLCRPSSVPSRPSYQPAV